MRGRHVDPLAFVYARALADVAEARGGESLLRETEDALSAFGEAWSEDRDLRAYFLSTMVPRDKKTASMANLMADFPPVLVDFVHLLLRRGRGRYIDQISVAFETLLDERLGRVHVTLTSATELPAERLATWSDQLQAATGLEPIVRTVVKPELLAGAILHVGETIADGSARRKLGEYKKLVRERGKHALQA